MADVALYPGAAAPSDVTLRRVNFPATATGSLPTVTLSSPTGVAHAKGGASGLVGTVTMSGVSGSATGKARGTATVGTVSLVVPGVAAHGNGAGSGAVSSGGVGSVIVSAPSGSAQGKARASGTLSAVAAVALSAVAHGTANTAAGMGTVTLGVPTGSGSAIPHRFPSPAYGALPIACVLPPTGYAVAVRGQHYRAELAAPSAQLSTTAIPNVFRASTTIVP